MTESISTDKLIVLAEAIKYLPESACQNIKKFQLTWIEINGMLLPEITIDYK